VGHLNLRFFLDADPGTGSGDFGRSLLTPRLPEVARDRTGLGGRGCVRDEDVGVVGTGIDVATTT